MTKVGIVVQRCHESVVGGSETLAWQYAQLLKDHYEVEVLTTTAVDANLWANALPEGSETRDGVLVRRFRVDVGGSHYRGLLFERLHRDFAAGMRKAASPGGPRRLPWGIPLQEEFITRIGPHSHGMMQFLRERWADYQTIIFLTYLYPPTHFGLLEVPADYALFVPTLHDEPPAYLSAYKHAARRARSIIWLTEAERRLGRRLWGEMPGSVVGMNIDAAPREPAAERSPYLLYCGRVDPNKGCGDLFAHFIRFKETHPSDLRLILTGKDDIPVPGHPDIEFRGFVSAEEKFSLMAGATVFVMPSGNESFSIVTLEAMAQRTPILASGACGVLVDHIKLSAAGKIYTDYESFADALGGMLSDDAGRAAMGAAGRKYVTSNYTAERVGRALIEVVESCPRVGDTRKASRVDDSPLVRAKASTAPRAGPAPSPASEVQSGQVPAPTLPPPLHLPPGWTEKEMSEMITSVLVEYGPPEEMKNYASADFKRFLYTLELVPREPGLALLELGANPYFTTTLLHKFRDVELHLANYFGDGGATEGRQKVVIGKTGEELTFRFKHFNVEADEFPYADNSFDVVLFCEIIEHLVADPVRALLGIRRVLKPGGVLILTTPNVARLDNVLKIVAGENIYDPYSGYGIYGRHNREYTGRDLTDMLTANGYRVETIFTADVHEGYSGSPLSVREAEDLVKFRPLDLGQYIFIRCTVEPSTKDSSPIYPDWLYRSFHADPPTTSRGTE